MRAKVAFIASMTLVSLTWAASGCTSSNGNGSKPSAAATTSPRKVTRRPTKRILPPNAKQKASVAVSDEQPALALSITPATQTVPFDPHAPSLSGTQPTTCLDDNVTFTATLTNQSANPVTASLYGPGNIGTSEVGMDGYEAAARFQKATDHHVSIGVAQAKKLTTLAPGQSGSFTFKRICPTFFQEGETISLQSYDLNDPGTFKVTFYYQYVGPDNGLPNVFHDSVEADPVYVTFQ